MTKVRWGILSTAKIAQEQLIPAIQRSTNAEVIAIASNSGKADDVAANFGIQKVYESYDALLQDPDIDAVYIPLPNHLHKKWTIEAAKQGKHVLCEKPASLVAEETEEMVNVCKDENVKFMEAFMYQFHPQHERVREIIKSGEIGEVKHMRVSFSFYLAEMEGNIRMDPKTGGGSIYDIGCYAIHSIRHLLQVEPTEVSVRATIDEKFGVDTSAFAYLKLENGIQATFDCSFEMTFRSEYEIVGTKGLIRVPRAFRPDNNGGEGIVQVHIDGEMREEKIVGDIYKSEVELFSDAILKNIDPPYSGEKALKNMRVIDACYESIKTGQPVKM